MKVVLVADGKRVEVDLDLAAGTASVDGRTFPLRVVAEAPLKVELEIAGDPVVVEGWPSGCEAPPGRVTVNGELHTLAVERRDAVGEGPPAAPRAASAPATPAGPDRSAEAGDGVAVAPPMPGKVVELRVKDGDRVTAGQVLLVLEAMKMRNEVASPVAGVVTDVRVSAGANVRAREPMLRVRPAPPT